MIRTLTWVLAVVVLVTALEWRQLSRSPSATRWLFAVGLLLSVWLYVYQARDENVWRPSEWLGLFAPASGPP